MTRLCSPVRHPGAIEPLEARIAPAATIFIGAPDGTSFDTTKDTEYREANPTPEFQKRFFVDVENASDPISLAVQDPATLPTLNSNTFYLRLEAGDEIQAFRVGDGYRSILTVSSGRAIVFFTDLDGDNDFDDGEMTGIALGRGARLVLSTNLNGDIVTNLDERGTSTIADDTIDMTGLVSNTQGISSLQVRGGSVFGNVYSGGPIASLFIANNVETVLAGTAAHGAQFDFFTGSAGGKGTLAVAAPVGSKGASISNATIGSITDRLEAGGGGIGGAGGSLSNIQITGDNDGFKLLAGDGGAADAGLRKSNGGAGGSITTVYVSGVSDTTPNSGTGIQVRAGDGGDGLNTGTGGAGGRLTNVFIGFQLAGKTRLPSPNLLADNLLIEAGAGGSGRTGGAGGSLVTSLVLLQTPDAVGDEIVLAAGAGGDSVAPTGGRAGAGGSITGANVRNQTSTFNTDTVVIAGDGGSTVGNALGAAGGSISRTTLLGFDLQVLAGDGSAGKTGGAGGSISDLTITNSVGGQRELIARNVLLNAGKGGNASAGNAGKGGSVLNVTADKMDVQLFSINSGLQGDGGTAQGGRGGAGGAVVNVLAIDDDSGFGLTGTMNLRAGNGGDGTAGGGAGGVLDRVFAAGLNANVALTAGLGGDATTLGRGGNGGSITRSDITATGQVAQVNVSGTATAGTGGIGVGRRGAGGVGGSLQTVNVDADGNVSMFAGDGGSGEDAVGGGAAGRGGSVVSSAGFALFGAGEVRAGDAGVLGLGAGAGGSILGNAKTGSSVSGLLAATSVTIVAGDGSNGGAGGDIRGIAYGSTSETLLPTPRGNILLEAGAGSAEGKLAGRGGHLDRLFGSVSSGQGATTQFIAGDGGGAADRAAEGGSISNIEITFGGGRGVVLTLEAGDGGDAANAKSGARGGSVRGVAVTNLDENTIFRSVAAGDGGDASRVGGLGGSIERISVEGHDIGVRTGEVYGYTTMGGLFAGLGGAAGGVGGKAGLAGSVNIINADSIAAIVAGRGLIPQFAERVDNILLNDSNQLLARDRGFGANAPFTLNFLGEETAILEANADPSDVQAALNALPSIQAAGGVTVADGPIVDGFPTYEVRWNANGDQVLLSGTERQGSTVVETVQGQILPFLSIETFQGSEALGTTETEPGDRALQVVTTRSGNTPVAAIEIIRGDDVGPPPVQEQQQIDLSALQTSPAGQFTLSFGGDTTIVLPKTATALDVQNALNNLVAIQAVGNVTVASPSALSFVVTFTRAQDILDLVTGGLLIEEQQRLSLGPLSAFADATFDFSIKQGTTPTQKTVQIPANADAAAIEAALNGLTSINAPANPNDGVTVTGGSGIFFINFRATGDQGLLVATGHVPETQTIDLGSQPAGSEIRFNFGSGFVTVPSGSTPAVIQTALNSLATIKATKAGNTGAVTVAAGALNNIVITFNSVGEKEPIVAEALRNEQQTLDLSPTAGQSTGSFVINVTQNVPVFEGEPGESGALFVDEQVNGGFSLVPTSTATDGTASVREVQIIDLSSIIRVPAGEFTLTYNGATTPFLLSNISPANLQIALNLLPTIAADGGVTVTSSTTPNTVQVVWNNNGQRNQITSNAGAREVQTVDLDLLAAQTGTEFVLEFGGERTIPLAATATTTEVDNALSALPSIIARGGVTVTQPVSGTFSIRFDTFGNVPKLIGVGGGPGDRESQILDLRRFIGEAGTAFNLTFGAGTTTTLGGAATAADIQNALNALISIQSIRSAPIGAVTVTETSAGSELFQVVFNIFGDQPSISGLGTVNGGATVRLPSTASAADIQSAINAVSFSTANVVVTGSGPSFAVDFNENGDQTALAVTGFIQEIQIVDVLATGDFTLRFGSDFTTVLPVNATAQEVQDALNLLPAVLALAPGNTGSVTVTKPVASESQYFVRFNADGDINSAAGTQFLPLTFSTAQSGTGTRPEIQLVGYQAKGNFDPVTYLSANLVGAIADANELGANIFKFIELNGTPGFNLGDQPIDGLIVARVVNQPRLNFTPEARLSATGFFDHDNFI
jgi:hypothetical protein